MARILAAPLVLFLAGAAVLRAQPPTDIVVTQNGLEFHSAFWPNLHSVLWAEAWARRPLKPGELSTAGSLPERIPASVPVGERKAWDDAIAYYDREIADLHPLFDATSTAIRLAMINPVADLPGVGLDDAHRSVLLSAATINRQHLWPSDARSTRPLC